MDLTMQEPRVFVIQEQHRWDGKKLVPKFDLSPARVYGSLEFLLSPNAHAFNPDPVVVELEEKLKTFTCDDFLLLVGNPVLIGITCIIAARQTHGILQVLQWSGKDQRYTKIDINLSVGRLV